MLFGKRSLTENHIRDVLQTIIDPLTGRDIVSAGWVNGIVIQDSHALVTLDIDPARAQDLEVLRKDTENKLQQLKRVKSARVVMTAQHTQKPALVKPTPSDKPLLPHVKHVIAVASGKGGVGKSTVAANLAVALTQQGLKIGLLDADIYGPSVPMMMGVRQGKPEQVQEGIVPLDAHGVKVMSMGFLVPEDKAMIWRGPMVQSALLQMLRDVQWGELDILLIDMPPGTGDIQLTLAQRVPLAGAVIVSTPQDIALLDAVKAVEMFNKTAVPILGIVENMSIFCCPNCGHETAVFGHGGAQQRAAELGVPFLGAIPLEAIIRTESDRGMPVVNNKNTKSAMSFVDIAQKTAIALETRKAVPKIIIEADDV